MIKKLIIENFRSIKKQEIELSQINAFVGPNNAGKSNIMKALNLIIGETWPSKRSFDDKDFFNYEKSNPIKIEVHFDSPLTPIKGCNSLAYGFRLTFDGDDTEYHAIDNNGNVLKYFNDKDIKVSNQLRDEVPLMYLGLDRQASQQIKATQWTLYGKLLKNIEKGISSTNKEQFRKGIDSSYNSNIYPYLKDMEGILKDYVKEHTGLYLNLRLSILDPMETLNNLRPYLQEMQSSMEFDAEDMGAGTQSALAIAIALAYAKIVRNSVIIAIEEPELYLHPHGCRNFYKLLKELSQEGIQIVYTTHERSFVDMSNFQSIHLVRKESGETKVCSAIGKNISSEDEIKNASKFDENLNEVFFANHVVLVEGFSDKIACRLALEKLEVDPDKESISIIDCGGIKTINPIASVLKNFFNIPTYALVDEDPGNPETQVAISQLKDSLGEENVFLQTPNLQGMFGLKIKPDRKEALEVFPEWFKDNNNKVPKIYEQLVNNIKGV